MKLSLNRVWDRTAALTDVSRSTAQKIVEEKKALDDFDQGVVRRTVASMYSLKKFLPTLDSIRTEYWLHWQQGSSSQRSPSYEAVGESKSADGETRCSPQQDQITS